MVNGRVLTDAQSCVIRCAIADFLYQLADPEYCKQLGPIADSYRSRLSEVQNLIFEGLVK